MVYQLDGNRLIALVSLDDLLDIMSNEDDLPQELQQAEPSQLLEDWSGLVLEKVWDVVSFELSSKVVWGGPGGPVVTYLVKSESVVSVIHCCQEFWLFVVLNQGVTQVLRQLHGGTLWEDDAIYP